MVDARIAGERRLAAGLLLGGCLPFALGAAVPFAAVDDGPVLCPFRAATGLPCPLCGAMRAFVLAGHGDGRLLEYNAVWPLVAALALVAGAAALGVASRGGTPLTALRASGGPLLRSPPRMAAVLALMAAPPWAWALAHASTIAPPG